MLIWKDNIIKYFRPELHLVSASKAAAECVAGSDVAHDGTCDFGKIVCRLEPM
jgi:hypothetical protein